MNYPTKDLVKMDLYGDQKLLYADLCVFTTTSIDSGIMPLLILLLCSTLCRNLANL